MTQVYAGITSSLDGFITGPNDRPGQGLGEGGERLHYWVFGGPWSYDSDPTGEPTGADKAFLDGTMAHLGAVIAGRGTYDAAEGWGDSNPWPVPLFIVTHRPEQQPAGDQFQFVGSIGETLERARAAAGDKDVYIMGGADVIRQALGAGEIGELSISFAPVVLGAGKALFDGSTKVPDMEPVRVLQSQFATHITYQVRT